MAYISNALEQQKVAKQFDSVGMMEMAIFHTRKAIKIMEQLHKLRGENYPEYQVLLAPFYYKIGDLLVLYIESNMNEMNQLKPLELPEDPEEVEEGDDAQSKEEEKVPEGSEQNEAASEKNEEAEPVIEDVIDSA